MAEIASAFVTVAPSARGFGSKLQGQVGPEVSSAGKGVGSKFGTAIKGGALAALGGAALIGGFLKGSIGEARDAQKVGALTNAVIKSTGGIANVTAKDVDRLATSISLKTGVDDEAIAAGQNMLLTFGNVRNEVGKGNDIFSQATVAATDMAAAFGGDAVSNSKILGKALNDPTKGVSALTRVGVSFTEQQKEQIKTFQESGNILGAQKIVLGELSKQTEGAAESQASAADKAKVAFGNLQESVGTALLPAVDGLLNGITGAITGFMTAFDRGGLSGVATLVGQKIAEALPVIKANLKLWGIAFVDWVREVLPPLLVKLGTLYGQLQAWIWGTALPKLVAALVRWGKAFVEWIGPQIPPMIAKLGELASRLFSWLIDVGLPRLLSNLKRWGEALVRWIKPMIPPVIAAIASLLGRLVVWIVGTGLPKLLGGLLKLGVALVKWIAPQIPKVIADMAGLMGKLAGWILSTGLPLLAEKMLQLGNKAFDKLKAASQSGTTAVIDFMKGIPGRLVAALGDLGSLFYNKGVELIAGFARGITAKMADAINAVQSGLSRIKGLLPGSPIKWGPLKNWNNGGAGKRLMDLVAKGITDATPKTVKAARSAFEKIGDSLEATRDRLQGTLDGLKSDFASISDSVSTAFTGNLFEATTASDFIANLTAKKGELTGLLASFNTLKGWGVDPAFLSQLFASGNGALITELAGMGQSGAVGAASLFGEVNSLGDQLGNAVASNDPVATRLDETNRLLVENAKQIKFLRDDIGKKIPEAVKQGAREGTREGNDERTKDTRQRERAGR